MTDTKQYHYRIAVVCDAILGIILYLIVVAGLRPNGIVRGSIASVVVFVVFLACAAAGLVVHRRFGEGATDSIILNVLTVAGRHPMLFLLLLGAGNYYRFLWNGIDVTAGIIGRCAGLMQCAGICMLLSVVLRVLQVCGWHPGSADVRWIGIVGAYYQRWRHVVDILFYVTFTAVYLWLFIQTTMLPAITNSTPFGVIRVVSQDLALVIALLRFWNEKSVRTTVAWCIILAAGVAVWHVDSEITVLYLCLLVVAADGMSARRMLQIYVVGALAVLIGAWWAALHGYAVWLNYEGHGYALGGVYRTDIAAHWFYLTMAYRILRGKRMTAWEYAIQACVIYYIYHLTSGKTFLIVAPLFLVLCMLADCIPEKCWIIPIRKCAMAFGSLWFSLCAAGTYLVVYLYGDSLMGMDITLDMPFATVLHRIKLSYIAFLEYPVTLFGQHIDQRGAGGIDAPSGADYFFLDSMYVNLLLISGVVFLVVMLGMHTYLMRRSVRECHYTIWIAMFVIAIDSIMEHHLTWICYNVFPLLMWTVWDMDGRHKAEEEIIDQSYNRA